MAVVTRDEVLQRLAQAFPRHLDLEDFDAAPADRQLLLDLLFTLCRDGLIEGKFATSAMRGQYGVPSDVRGVIITEKGAAFLEGGGEKTNMVTQNITISGATTTLNIAGRDVNNAGAIDHDELCRTILAAIEQSGLKAEEKAGLVKTMKGVFSSASAGVIAGIIVASVKKVLGLP